MKLPVYSYTFFSTWDICRRQAFHRYVLKDIPFKETEAMRWGTNVHTAMEKRVREGKELPQEMKMYEPYALALVNLKPQCEMKLGIRKDGSPCAFFDSDVWLRGKADVATKHETTALLFDYKTGKRREDAYELEIQALMLNAAWPEITKIIGQYIWLKDHDIGKAHDVSDTAATFENTQEKADEIESAFRRGDWPERPGPLCGWCDDFTCQHNPRGRK